MTVFAYCRVSTDAQDAANQRHAVEKYCRKLGHDSYMMVEDKVSGTVTWRKRKLGEIILKSLPGDVLIVSEVSRIARSTLQVLEFMQVTAEKGLTIRVVNGDLVLDNSLQGQIHATILGLAGQIERHFISVRARQGAANAKAQGKKLGRPAGSQAKVLKLDSYRREIEKLLAKGVSKASIAKICDCSRVTLDAWLDRRNISH